MAAIGRNYNFKRDFIVGLVSLCSIRAEQDRGGGKKSCPGAYQLRANYQVSAFNKFPYLRRFGACAASVHERSMPEGARIKEFSH